MTPESEAALAYAVAAYENYIAGRMASREAEAAMTWCCWPLETHIPELLMMVHSEMRDSAGRR